VLVVVVVVVTGCVVVVVGVVVVTVGIHLVYHVGVAHCALGYGHLARFVLSQ